MGFNKRKIEKMTLTIAPVNRSVMLPAAKAKPGSDVNIQWSCMRGKGYDPLIEELEWKLKNGLAVDSRKRMSRSEQDTYMKMIAATDLLLDLKDTAENWKRFREIPNGMKYLKTIITLMEKLDNGMSSKVEALQMIAIRKTIPYLRVWVHSEDVAEDVKGKDGRFLSYNDLNILATAVRNECMMCSLDLEDQKKCCYRSVLDKLPIDAPDDTRSGCPWMETLC